MGFTLEGENASYVMLLEPDGETPVGTVAAPLIVGDPWKLRLINSETANDSDKTFTVLQGEMYQVLWVWVELASSADAGDRQLELQILDDAADVVAEFKAGATQAADETRHYIFAPSLADLTGFRDTDWLMTPLPPTLVLPENWAVRVWDNAAIAPAADDMVVQMQVAFAPVAA